jgi:hypothetical protein
MKVAGDYVKGEWGKVKCEKAGSPRHSPGCAAGVQSRVCGTGMTSGLYLSFDVPEFPVLFIP